jgi:hypothetical protein
MMRLSRSRRARTLAAPIVVTAVLAPACSGRTHTNPREPEERPQPEPTETAVPTAQPEPTATAAASGSATAIDLAKLPVVPKDANGRFERNDDGSCTFYPRDDCPPGATCNPGPPRQVRCHDGVPDKPSK